LTYSVAERLEQAARAHAGGLRDHPQGQRPLPVGLDEFFRAPHLPWRDSPRAALQQAAEIVRVGMKERHQHALLEFGEHGCRQRLAIVVEFGDEEFDELLQASQLRFARIGRRFENEILTDGNSDHGAEHATQRGGVNVENDLRKVVVEIVDSFIMRRNEARPISIDPTTLRAERRRRAAGNAELLAHRIDGAATNLRRRGVGQVCQRYVIEANEVTGGGEFAGMTAEIETGYVR
jgi:hypothetical protein